MNIVFLGPPAKRPKDSQVLAGWIEDGLSTTTRSPIGDLGAEFDLAEGELAQSQAGISERLIRRAQQKSARRRSLSKPENVDLSLRRCISHATLLAAFSGDWLCRSSSTCLAEMASSEGVLNPLHRGMLGVLHLHPMGETPAR